MWPPTILVWRVRLLLLALAMGLSALHTGESPVQPSEAVEAVAPQSPHQGSREAAAALRARSADSFVSSTAPGVATLGMTRLVAPQAGRASCSDRSVSRPQSAQASAHSRRCRSAASRVGTRSVTTLQKQKISSLRSAKKQTKLAATRKSGSGAVIRLATKGNGKTTVAAAKLRHATASKANS